MDKQLQIFSNPKFGEIRIVEINNKPYAVGIDVARALGYKDPNSAITRHCKGSVKHPVPTTSGEQLMNVIPRGDIYRLAASSELPGAEEFESWIFDEVVPLIDQHGAYMTHATIEKVLSDPDTIIQLATRLKEEREHNKLLTDKLDQQKPLVQFAETCIASDDSILVRELAKLASKKGISIGEKRLYKKLKDWGLILNSKNEPSQRAMDAGYFEVKKGAYSTPYGSQTYATSLVTPKGQVYIIEKLKNELHNEAV